MSDAGSTDTPDHPQTMANAQPLSRRAVLLNLAGSLVAAAAPPFPEIARLPGDVVVVDGWILRVDDLQWMPSIVA